MPTFAYTSRDERGRVQTGLLDAINEDEVVAMLQQRGLAVTAVTRKDLRSVQGPHSQKAPLRRMHGGVSVDDQVLLCQQLSTLVEAGVPLLRGLEVVCRQVESRRLLLTLDDVRRDVSGGRTFREALARHPGIFSNLWLNLVETGEASGHLATSLRQLARHFESAQKLHNEVTTALTYPMFLLLAAFGVVTFFLYFVLPRFETMFTVFQVELPWITQVLLETSEFCRRNVVLLACSLIGAGGLLKWYVSTEAGQWTRDRLLLKAPVIGTMLTYVQLAEFSRGLATLLESGVPLLTGLEILERSASNRVYGSAIRSVRDSVKEGKTMAEPMGTSGRFPPMAIQMVQVGEEVGELGKMMERVARYYEERIELFIVRMTRLFEPVAIVVLGGIVLTIVLSIFLPIFKASTAPRF